MLYIDRRGWFHKLHPFTKLMFLLLSGSLSYMSGLGILPLSVVLGIYLILLPCGKILFDSVKMMGRILLPLAFFMIPIHSFLYPGNSTAIFNIFGFIVYQEGFSFALKTLLQLSIVLSASLLFVFTTHPADLITAVTQAGGSSSLGYLIGFPLLLLDTMKERVVTIQNAQRARGLGVDGNLFRRFASLGPLLSSAHRRNCQYRTAIYCS